MRWTGKAVLRKRLGEKILFGYFFWLDLDDVWVLAELTDPNLIPFLDIDRLDQIFFFHGLHFLVLGQLHLHLLFFLVVSFVGLLFVLLDLLLYVIRQLLLDYHLLGLWCLVLVFLALWHLQILLARDHVRILIYAGMALLAENWVSHGLFESTHFIFQHTNITK